MSSRRSADDFAARERSMTIKSTATNTKEGKADVKPTPLQAWRHAVDDIRPSRPAKKLFQHLRNNVDLAFPEYSWASIPLNEFEVRIIANSIKKSLCLPIFRCPLRVLNLENCRIDYGRAHFLAKGLAGNTTLEYLDLSRNPLTADGVAEILNGLYGSIRLLGDPQEYDIEGRPVRRKSIPSNPESVIVTEGETSSRVPTTMMETVVEDEEFEGEGSPDYKGSVGVEVEFDDDELRDIVGTLPTLTPSSSAPSPVLAGASHSQGFSSSISVRKDNDSTRTPERQSSAYVTPLDTSGLSVRTPDNASSNHSGVDSRSESPSVVQNPLVPIDANSSRRPMTSVTALRSILSRPNTAVPLDAEGVPLPHPLRYLSLSQSLLCVPHEAYTNQRSVFPLSDRGLIALSQFLTHPCCSLENLNISKNKLRIEVPEAVKSMNSAELEKGSTQDFVDASGSREDAKISALRLNLLKQVEKHNRSIVTGLAVAIQENASLRTIGLHHTALGPVLGSVVLCKGLGLTANHGANAMSDSRIGFNQAGRFNVRVVAQDFLSDYNKVIEEAAAAAAATGETEIQDNPPDVHDSNPNVINMNEGSSPINMETTAESGSFAVPASMSTGADEGSSRASLRSRDISTKHGRSSTLNKTSDFSKDSTVAPTSRVDSEASKDSIFYELNADLQRPPVVEKIEFEPTSLDSDSRWRMLKHARECALADRRTLSVVNDIIVEELIKEDALLDAAEKVDKKHSRALQRMRTDPEFIAFREEQQQRRRERLARTAKRLGSTLHAAKAVEAFYSGRHLGGGKAEMTEEMVEQEDFELFIHIKEEQKAVRGAHELSSTKASVSRLLCDVSASETVELDKEKNPKLPLIGRHQQVGKITVLRSSVTMEGLRELAQDTFQYNIPKPTEVDTLSFSERCEGAFKLNLSSCDLGDCSMVAFASLFLAAERADELERGGRKWRRANLAKENAVFKKLVPNDTPELNRYERSQMYRSLGPSALRSIRQQNRRFEALMTQSGAGSPSDSLGSSRFDSSLFNTSARGVDDIILQSSEISTLSVSRAVLQQPMLSQLGPGQQHTMMTLGRCLAPRSSGFLHNLRWLKLRRNGISSLGLKFLLRGVIAAPTLVRLDLSHNPLGPAGAALLGGFLAHPRCCLKQLIVDNCGFSLGPGGISGEEADRRKEEGLLQLISLGRTLSRAEPHRSNRLDGFHVDKEQPPVNKGFQALLFNIRENRSLEVLSMQANGLVPPRRAQERVKDSLYLVRTLCDSLARNRTLGSIDLRGNNIRDAGRALLERSLKQDTYFVPLAEEIAALLTAWLDQMIFENHWKGRNAANDLDEFKLQFQNFKPSLPATSNVSNSPKNGDSKNADLKNSEKTIIISDKDVVSTSKKKKTPEELRAEKEREEEMRTQAQKGQAYMNLIAATRGITIPEGFGSSRTNTAAASPMHSPEKGSSTVATNSPSGKNGIHTSRSVNSIVSSSDPKKSLTSSVLAFLDATRPAWAEPTVAAGVSSQRKKKEVKQTTLVSEAVTQYNLADDALDEAISTLDKLSPSRSLQAVTIGVTVALPYYFPLLSTDPLSNADSSPGSNSSALVDRVLITSMPGRPVSIPKLNFSKLQKYAGISPQNAFHNIQDGIDDVFLYVARKAASLGIPPHYELPEAYEQLAALLDPDSFIDSYAATRNSPSSNSVADIDDLDGLEAPRVDPAEASSFKTILDGLRREYEVQDDIDGWEMSEKKLLPNHNEQKKVSSITSSASNSIQPGKSLEVDPSLEAVLLDTIHTSQTSSLRNSHQGSLRSSIAPSFVENMPVLGDARAEAQNCGDNASEGSQTGNLNVSSTQDTLLSMEVLQNLMNSRFSANSNRTLKSDALSQGGRSSTEQSKPNSVVIGEVAGFQTSASIINSNVNNNNNKTDNITSGKSDVVDTENVFVRAILSSRPNSASNRRSNIRDPLGKIGETSDDDKVLSILNQIRSANSSRPVSVASGSRPTSATSSRTEQEKLESHIASAEIPKNLLLLGRPPRPSSQSISRQIAMDLQHHHASHPPTPLDGDFRPFDNPIESVRSTNFPDKPTTSLTLGETSSFSDLRLGPATIDSARDPLSAEIGGFRAPSNPVGKNDSSDSLDLKLRLNLSPQQSANSTAFLDTSQGPNHAEDSARSYMSDYLRPNSNSNEGVNCSVGDSAPGITTAIPPSTQSNLQDEENTLLSSNENVKKAHAIFNSNVKSNANVGQGANASGTERFTHNKSELSLSSNSVQSLNSTGNPPGRAVNNAAVLSATRYRSLGLRELTDINIHRLLHLRKDLLSMVFDYLGEPRNIVI